ncbi:MAG: squalene synthase HpnC [Rhodospirillaceae bacterium]
MVQTAAPTSETVETPSGKDAGYENFPVGSFMLPAALRPHIAAFYRFARAIDDIADNRGLDPETKIARLSGFESGVLGRGPDHPAYDTARRMRLSLAETGITPQHCLDLIAAFKQDAVKLRYADWDDLMGYCIKSAAPVGRYLVDLHGGMKPGKGRGGYGPADALCNALQVINHLQDLKDDYRTLDRVYLPGNWMAAEGVTVEDLNRAAATPELRRVIDRCLDATEALLRDVPPLISGVKSRRLAMESAAILEIAWRLCRALCRRDPIAGRVKLSKVGYLWCCIRGAVAAVTGIGRR